TMYCQVCSMMRRLRRARRVELRLPSGSPFTSFPSGPAGTYADQPTRHAAMNARRKHTMTENAQSAHAHPSPESGDNRKPEEWSWSAPAGLPVYGRSPDAYPPDYTVPWEFTPPLQPDSLDAPSAPAA